ncbi:unnamed protein product, partial [Ixodes hexagonus]
QASRDSPANRDWTAGTACPESLASTAFRAGTAWTEFPAATDTTARPASRGGRALMAPTGFRWLICSTLKNPRSKRTSANAPSAHLTTDRPKKKFFAVPPSIVDTEQSQHVLLTEGEKLSLRCPATGQPEPTVTWRRDDASAIPFGSWYLPPLIKIHNWAVGASNGSSVQLECLVEAFPRAVSGWLFGDQGSLLQAGPRHSLREEDAGPFGSRLQLRISPVLPQDFGMYKCDSRNARGHAAGVLTVFGEDR